MSPPKEEIAFEQDLERVRGLLRHNDVEGAERLCRNLISRHPGRAQAHEQLGRILLRAERFEDALTELKTAVQIDPAFAPAWKSMAIVGLTGGDSTVAEMAARRLCALRADDPWSWFMLGHALSTMSRFDEAETVFERARRSPGALEARISLVQDAITRNNLHGAIKHGEAVTRWAPGVANAWAALGHAFTCAGQHQPAVEALRKACQIAPRDAESLKRLATSLGMLRRADDELVDIRQRLLALEPESIEAPSGTTLTCRPQYPPIDEARAELQFQKAVAQARAGHWQDSGRGFAEAWHSAPDQPRSAQGMLECALHLARSGIVAPAVDLHSAPRAAGRISIIVCSIDPRRLARLKVDLDRLLCQEDWELIHIPDARSLCEGYTRGLVRARGELIVFCHDDIGILCEDFADRLRRHLAVHDLIGVAGSDYVNGPSWHWAGPPHTASWVSLPRPDGALVCGLLGAHGQLLRDAQALDGVFLAGRRAVFEQIPFDADTFDGFHCYDLDLSYRAYRAGLRCAVTLDLLIWHQSGGNFGDSWRQYVDRLIAKFPELTPRGPAAPYRTGAIVVESALAAPVYGWIAHWLSATPSTID